ncbi:MAG TPA: hypothetical protein PKO15_00015 [Fibrobacteria bacterium]|nr:hypothetical protein [Fibrobacteria bacterium]
MNGLLGCGLTLRGEAMDQWVEKPAGDNGVSAGLRVREGASMGRERGAMTGSMFSL